jgi:hypothetical protein
MPDFQRLTRVNVKHALGFRTQEDFGPSEQRRLMRPDTVTPISECRCRRKDAGHYH